MSVSALALAVSSGPSFAAQLCDLSDGFAMTPAAFSQEADACLEGLNGVKSDSYLTNQLLSLAGDYRKNANEERLESLATLNKAARVHAYDMAVRGYAAHEDLEGRSHLDRVRILDRRVLIGAFGANVIITDAGQSAEEIQQLIVADNANADNFTRKEFDHVGMAAVESDGRLYIVQLFARVDGQLEEALPSVAVPGMNVQAAFSNEKLEPVGWSVVSASGETLLRGSGTTIPRTMPNHEGGYLELDVALGTDVYTLKGPALSPL